MNTKKPTWYVTCPPKCGGRPLLHEHEVAVQTTAQPGNCSPPPGTYRAGAIISNLLGCTPAIQGTWHVLPIISMAWYGGMVEGGIVVDSVTCLRYAECSRAPGCIIRDMVT